MEKNLFQKRFAILPCAVAVIVFIIGCAALFIDNAVSFILGFLIIAFSAIYFFTGTKRWYNIESRKFYNKKDYYLKKEKQAYIEGLLKDKDLEDIKKEEVDFCSNLRMEVWTSRDKKECYAQLFSYVPHEYEPISDIIRIF